MVYAHELDSTMTQIPYPFSFNNLCPIASNETVPRTLGSKLLGEQTYIAPIYVRLYDLKVDILLA